MYKDFDSWNEKKKYLENVDKKFLFNEREIWWCSVGINVGNEPCGKGGDFRRPVLIIKKLSKHCVIGVPISTQIKNGDWFCVIDTLLGKRSVLLSQIRMFNSSRFQHKLHVMDEKNFAIIKQKLEKLLELCNHHQGDYTPWIGGKSQKRESSTTQENLQ